MELSFVFFILLLITLPYDHRVKSQLIYERLTYYLDTSTSAQNMTCQGCTTIHQSSTMASPNMMEFKINTAYGYQNLFYTLELHTQIQSTPTITFYESGITVQMIETKIQMKLNSFICSQATYIFLIQFTSITYMNEQQVTLLVSSNSQNIFWIKNLNIYAQRCQPNCKKCSASDCQECMNDFEFNELRVCQCKQQFLTFFEGQCITQCPVNHIFDGETCLKYNQLINLFYDDTASKFTMKPDYNTTLRESKITLEGQLVAGLFIQNEAVEYQINYPTGSVFNILLKLEIYLLNYSKNLKQLQLFIKYNQILVSQKELIYNELFDTRKQIKPIQCNIIGFTSCFKLTIHQYIQNISDISSLQLYMNLPFERQEVSWAISKVQLDGITISPINCPQKRFENQCYDECPLISRSLGDECISILNDYKFSNILDVSYSDRSVQNQKIDIYNPCDLLQFSPYPYCNFYQKRYILGGFQIWQNNQTQLVLESMKPHYKVKLFFKAILIDPVDISLNLTVSIDQTKYILNKNSPNSYCFSSVATSGCIIQEDLGQTTADYLINFEQEFDHSKTTLEVFLVCNAQKLSMSYCALYDLIILQINCPENCLVCQSNSNCLKKDQDLPVFYECARDGYFLSEGSCKKCLDFCKTCSNAYSCLTCKDQYFQYGNLCICKLNQVNAMHSSCSNDCHSSCSICQNQLTQNTLLKLIKFDQLCAFCDPNEHKVFNVDICECFSGYYMDTKISPSNCQLCSEKCKTCSDGKFCTTCYSEQNRIYEDYDCKCKEGYFQNGLDPNCIKCMNFCKSCLYKEEYCIQCYPEQYRVLSKENTCICQIGYYDNKSDVCLKCSDNCNSCINYSICTSCNEFQFRKLDKINKECICQLGYYDNNDLTCLPCYYACSTCNKSSLKSQCTLCPKTRQKSTNSLETFECKCRKGYFDDGYLECQPCVNLINPPITHYCYSFCGDLIVQWNEECDDGNLDPRDGCHKCFIQNDNCIDNICLKCYNYKQIYFQTKIFNHKIICVFCVLMDIIQIMILHVLSQNFQVSIIQCKTNEFIYIFSVLLLLLQTKLISQKKSNNFDYNKLKQPTKFILS